MIRCTVFKHEDKIESISFNAMSKEAAGDLVLAFARAGIYAKTWDTGDAEQKHVVNISISLEATEYSK